MAEVSNLLVNNRSLLRWLALPLLLLGLASGLTIYAIAIRAKALSVLRDVSALRVGVSSTADLEALATRHQNVLRERRCDGSEVPLSRSRSTTLGYIG